MSDHQLVHQQRAIWGPNITTNTSLGLSGGITQTPVTEINRANMEIYKNYVKMELKRGKQEKEARMRKLRLDAQLERARAKAIYDSRIKEIANIQKQETININDLFDKGSQDLIEYQSRMWTNLTTSCTANGM